MGQRKATKVMEEISLYYVLGQRVIFLFYPQQQQQNTFIISVAD